MIAARALISCLVAFAFIACGQAGSATLSAEDSITLGDRARRLAERMSDSTSGSSPAPVARWLLPASLNEVSGLALMSDGRLLAHGDEFGRISVIDPRRGVLLKEFSIAARADFEGITTTSVTIYMIDSNGEIYAFR